MFANWRNIALVVAFLTGFAAPALSAARAELPPPTFPHPISEPKDPSGWHTFEPPLANTTLPANVPVIAEVNATAGPDDSLTVTGENFGAHHVFSIFGQTRADNAALLDGKIQDACPSGDLITIPAAMPAHSMYLLWPKNEDGAIGLPVAINRTQGWWLSTESAAPGQAISVYGRDLSNGAQPPESWIYIESASGAGQWAPTKAVNPYKVEFTVPNGMSSGTVQVWVNNGLGGRLGWSGPIPLMITPSVGWTKVSINVKDFGATGNGKSDDAQAIQTAISALRPGSTLYFPAGTYRIATRQINLPNNVRLRGDGPKLSILRFEADLNALYKETGYGPYAIGAPDGWSGHAIGTQNVELDSLGLAYCGPSKDGGILRQRFGMHLALNDVYLQSGSVNATDWLGASDLTVHNVIVVGHGIRAYNVHHLAISASRFYLANDAEEAIAIWNSHEVSITQCTIQNLDGSANTSEGCGQGRFLENSLAWGSIHNEYIAGNSTVRLGNPHGGNSGEQINNEGSQYAFYGTPVSASATAITVASSASRPESLTGWNVIVTKGAGLGQLRTITAEKHEENGTVILSLDRSWSVIPNAQSHIQVCTTVYNCVFTDNTLECMAGPRGATFARAPAGLWAATGLELWDGGWGLVFDGNRTENLNTGILLASDDSLKSLASNPCYFIDILNNQINHSRAVGVCFQAAIYDNDPNFIGVTIRGNHIDGSLAYAPAAQETEPFSEGIWLPRSQHEESSTLSVLEHNTVVDVRVGIVISTDPNSLLYANTFNAGAATGAFTEGMAPGNGSPAIHNEQNSFQKFSRIAPASLVDKPESYK